MDNTQHLNNNAKHVLLIETIMQKHALLIELEHKTCVVAGHGKMRRGTQGHSPSGEEGTVSSFDLASVARRASVARWDARWAEALPEAHRGMMNNIFWRGLVSNT